MKSRLLATRLIVGVLVVNLFVYAMTALALYQSLRHYEHRAELTTRNLARSLAINVSGIVDKIDIGLFAVTTEVERQIGGGIDEKSLNAYLAGQKAQIRDFEALWVADAGGNIRWGTEIPAGKPVNIADREYFQRLRDNAASAMVISKPVIGRITNAWSIILARRINHPDGSFAGVGLGSLRAVDYFTKMFSAIDLGRQGLIGLRDDEMGLIARYPQDKTESGQPGGKVVSAKTFEMIRANPQAGTYKAVAAADGIERSFSYQKVAAYPLYIFVSISIDDALDPWRREAGITLALVLVFTLGSLLYARTSYRRTSELLATQVLERRKDDLEQQVKERTRELAAAKEAAEEGLQNERIVMSAIVEFSDDAIVGVALDGSVKTWNRGAERMLGYPADEMLGRSAFALIVPERRGEAKQSLAAIERGESVINFETGCLCRDGGCAEIAVTASPIRDKRGLVTGVSTIARDITERKRAQQALIESESRLSAVFHGSPIGISITNLATATFLDMNEMALQVLGYRRFEVIGRRSIDLGIYVHPAQRDEAMRQLREKGRLERYLIDFRKKTGEIGVLEYSGQVIESPGGPCIVGMWMDVTERKQMENQLRKLSLAIEQSPESIVITNVDASIAYANEAFFKATGYSPEDVIGQNPRVLQSGKTPRESYTEMWAALIQGQSWRGELCNRRKDGSEYVEFAVITPLRQADGTITDYVAVKEDISERKLGEAKIKQVSEELFELNMTLEARIRERTDELNVANLKLEASAEELARSNHDLEQFAYVASHDLQEPLRTVVGFVQLLERKLEGQLEGDAREYMGFAVDGARRMQSLINDILTYSRVASSGTKLESIDSAAALQEALALLSSQISNTGALVRTAQLPTVLASHAQLVQLFQNLIGNAIRFCNESAPRVSIEASREGQQWRFTITDNGIGIPAEHRDRIFVMFQRLHTRNEYEGTGIGLAICKRIVERHGGEIGVDPAPGGGSAFWFTLATVGSM
jgi:PAS domain S-box-containing protein